ncbi:MAG: 7-carboxy-7-deazaguanine synthase QueE [Desulfovibrio sp.]|nr:7-carboxy-7-deazaguanine synthase QueE [Desulfovibrio sp.]
MPRLFVNEVFRSVQGEGAWTGTPALFIRLQGCSVGCPWCDTAYAQDLLPQNRLPDEDAQVLRKAEPNAAYTCAHEAWLVRAALNMLGAVRHVVLSGGEPCAQPLFGLADTLLRSGCSVQLETSGTETLNCPSGVWVTLSPKARHVQPANWARADEIKLPVRHMEDVQRHAASLAKLAPEKIRLQPVSQDAAATELCVRLCLERNWRLSLQTHKFINLR